MRLGHYSVDETHISVFHQEFVSAGVGFILYSVVLLRVRGNLICNERKWSLRWVPRGQSWQLAIGRDLIDSSMLKVAQHMVW